MHVISKWTGVPLNRMEQAETQKLLKMEDEMRGKVIGQDEAVIAISKALRRSRADLKDPRRPIGSFIFLGPTGVGKTFLAQTLAEFMFGDRDALIQIDMSEYMEKFTASRLIGSPPGYVGHEEGGQLSEAVRRRPYSVVLFDEVEKAHPDVLHLLLQILEEGKLTDSLGRKIDFRNTIIIMTSNIGAELIKKSNVVGFGVSNRDEQAYDVMKDKILDEAKRVLKPEFVNRLDDLIVFHTLGKPELLKIVELESGRFSNGSRSRKFTSCLTRKRRSCSSRKATIRLTERDQCDGQWSVTSKIRWPRKSCAARLSRVIPRLFLRRTASSSFAFRNQRPNNQRARVRKTFGGFLLGRTDETTHFVRSHFPDIAWHYQPSEI